MVRKIKKPALASVAHSMLATLQAKWQLLLRQRIFILMRTAAQPAVREHIGGNNMARSSHHVIHNSNGGWDVKRNDAQHSSGHFATKEQAVSAGRQISQNQGTEFIVHGMNGRIQSTDSHGNDPCPPKG